MELSAQKQEVIVVYDTIVIRDTIRAYKKHKAILDLNFFAKQNQLIVLPIEKPAAISINNIIINDSINNSNEIKKTSFLDIADFGIVIGYDYLLNLPDHPATGEKVFAGDLQFGLYSSFYLQKKSLLRVDLLYSYRNGDNYRGVTHLITLAIDRHFLNSNYHNFTLPIRLVFNTGKLNPSIGFYYNYARATEKLWENNNSYSLNVNHIGFITGGAYNFSKHISFFSNIMFGINNYNINYGGTSTSNYQVRNFQINFGINFRLIKDKP